MVSPVTIIVWPLDPGKLIVPALDEALDTTGVEAFEKAQLAPISGLSLQKSTINSCSVVFGVNVTLYDTPVAPGVESLISIERGIRSEPTAITGDDKSINPYIVAMAAKNAARNVGAKLRKVDFM